MNLKEIIKSYNLAETSKSLGRSFALHCKFWKTGTKNVYLTDYDITNDTDLKIQDMLIMVNFRKGDFKYLSTKLFDDVEYVNGIIKKLS